MKTVRVLVTEESDFMHKIISIRFGEKYGASFGEPGSSLYSFISAKNTGSNAGKNMEYLANTEV